MFHITRLVQVSMFSLDQSCAKSKQLRISCIFQWFKLADLWIFWHEMVSNNISELHVCSYLDPVSAGWQTGWQDGSLAEDWHIFWKIPRKNSSQNKFFYFVISESRADTYWIIVCLGPYSFSHDQILQQNRILETILDFTVET